MLLSSWPNNIDTASCGDTADDLSNLRRVFTAASALQQRSFHCSRGHEETDARLMFVQRLLAPCTTEHRELLCQLGSKDEAIPSFSLSSYDDSCHRQRNRSVIKILSVGSTTRLDSQVALLIATLH